MMPAFFVYLDRIPLTTSGKVDRKSLPAPDLSLRQVGHTYVAPHTPLEKELTSVWESVLKVKQIGVHDNFFKLGGHSLLATQVCSRIRNTYTVDVSLKSLFEHPTIKALTPIIQSLIQEKKRSLVPPLVPMDRPEALPLSFAQQRLWFLDQLLPEVSLYNTPLALKLKGHLNLQALEKAFNALVDRHECLRTVFASKEGEAYQVILSTSTRKVSECLTDLSNLKKEDQDARVEVLSTQEANHPFNLSTGPLFRMKILKLSKEEHILFITFHHIIFDGWSIGIFFQELSVLYNAYASGKEPDLPPSLHSIRRLCTLATTLAPRRGLRPATCLLEKTARRHSRSS